MKKDTILTVVIAVVVITMVVTAMVVIAGLWMFSSQQSKTEEIPVNITGKVMIAETEEGVFYENLSELDFVELSEGVVVKATVYHSELDLENWDGNYSKVDWFTVFLPTKEEEEYRFQFMYNPHRNYQIQYNLYTDPDWLQPIEEITRTTWTTEISAETWFENNSMKGPDFYLGLITPTEETTLTKEQTLLLPGQSIKLDGITIKLTNLILNRDWCDKNYGNRTLELEGLLIFHEEFNITAPIYFLDKEYWQGAIQVSRYEENHIELRVYNETEYLYNKRIFEGQERKIENITVKFIKTQVRTETINGIVYPKVPGAIIKRL